RQGLAVVDLDGAAGAVVELAAGDGDVVEDQDLAGAEVDHAVVELGVDCGGAVDGAVAGDIDGAEIGRHGLVDTVHRAVAAQGSVVDDAAVDGDAVDRQ